MKSEGQKAYESHVVKYPLYSDGTPRKTWAELSTLCRSTWNKFK